MAANFFILIINKYSLGSYKVTHKIWTWSVQSFSRLLDTNKQTDTQTSKVYRDRSFVNRYIKKTSDPSCPNLTRGNYGSNPLLHNKGNYKGSNPSYPNKRKTTDTNRPNLTKETMDTNRPNLTKETTDTNHPNLTKETTVTNRPTSTRESYQSNPS